MPLKTKEKINEEWIKQLDYFTKKCGFNEDEKKTIIKLSKKLNLPPQRIIETIGVNTQNKKITEEVISDYKISIEQTKKTLAKNKEELNKIKDKKETFIDKIIPNKRILEFNIKRDESKLEKLNKILQILEESYNHPELAKKIVENTNYKPFERY